MRSVVSKRRPRSLLLIIPRPAARVPSQAGRRSAPPVHRELGQPAAAHDWEEGPAPQAKGVGRVPYGQEVGRTGRKLPLRALDLLSLPVPPLML